MQILKLGHATRPLPEKEYTFKCPSCYTVVRFKYSEARYHHRDDGDFLEIDCPVCSETSRVKA